MTGHEAVIMTVTIFGSLESGASARFGDVS
jgi:hypothetical protein